MASARAAESASADWDGSLVQPRRRVPWPIGHSAAVATASPRPLPTGHGELRAVFVVGTAGHVDHGKSTLVKALTGIDPDRLREERERAMTIDLGFAWLTLPGGRV